MVHCVLNHLTVVCELRDLLCLRPTYYCFAAVASRSAKFLLQLQRLRHCWTLLSAHKLEEILGHLSLGRHYL